MGDNVILISSESSSNDSNSPPTQRSGSYNTDFLGLGLGLGQDESMPSRTPLGLGLRTFSPFKRNVHDLSGSDSNEEDDCKLSLRRRPTTFAGSNEDSYQSSSHEPCESPHEVVGLPELGPLGRDLLVAGSRPSPSENDMLMPITLLKKNLQNFPDLEETNSQSFYNNNDDDMSLECGLQYNDKINMPIHIGKKTTIEQKRYMAKIARETKQAEKAKKLAEQAQAKAVKQALTKARQLLKPEECIKHLSAILDNNIFEQEFSGNLYKELEAAGVTYTVQSQIVPLTVSWIRQVHIDTSEGAKTTQHEQHSLLILPCNQLAQLIEKRGLCDYVQGVQAIAPTNSFTLILHGTDNFFKSNKRAKGKDICNISQDDLTEALVEVQLLANCDHRFVESCFELATTISQFSKAIAEIPYRLEKQKKEVDKLEWFGESDSRDCVRVDKNGNGLLRLWQQQLCEFNLAGLQMAEAITAMYPSPLALFQAYDSCSSQSQRETMLQDVPIRRGVGALSSVRRIGPELSKKLHTFFTTFDGEVDLSND